MSRHLEGPTPLRPPLARRSSCFGPRKALPPHSSMSWCPQRQGHRRAMEKKTVRAGGALQGSRALPPPRSISPRRPNRAATTRSGILRTENQRPGSSTAALQSGRARLPRSLSQPGHPTCRPMPDPERCIAVLIRCSMRIASASTSDPSPPRTVLRAFVRHAIAADQRKSVLRVANRSPRSDPSRPLPFAAMEVTLHRALRPRQRPTRSVRTTRLVRRAPDQGSSVPASRSLQQVFEAHMQSQKADSDAHESRCTAMH